MCRLYGFLANEPTKVECTLAYAQNALLHQSFSDLRGVSHADGWGIGCFENDHPTLERRETAAFRDAHFSLTAERIYARSVVAHVRHATVGPSAVVNTHPFAHGRWLFAHNGTVQGFDRLEPRLIRETDPDLRACRQGTTDSETAFYWMLSRLRAVEANDPSGHVELADLIVVMSESVRELAWRCAEAQPDAPPRLNFLLTDGHRLLGTRWNNSLHLVVRDGVHDCEICGIPHVQHTPGTSYRAVIVASEPISHEKWLEVDDHSLVAVDGDLSVHRERLDES